MNSTETEAATRQHEHILDIEASPEVVWAAITDPDQLVNWFPIEAAVEPGPGGRLTYRWDTLEGTCRIATWDPPRHLRTSWMEPGTDPDGSSRPLVVDWFLEGEGGHTRLRLVHSGFGEGSEWDEEYDGTRRGWTFELRSLKSYLERHAGGRRSAFWVRHPVSADAPDVWSRLLAPDGMVRAEGLDEAQPGDPVDFELASGDRIQGSVLSSNPPREIACYADNLDGGLFRFGFETCWGQPEAVLWVSVWDYPEDKVEALRGRLKNALASTFA